LFFNNLLRRPGGGGMSCGPGHGGDAADLYLPLARREGEAAAAFLQDRPGPADLAGFMARLLERADAFMHGAVRDFPPPRPLACSLGCHFCCHGKTEATELEILHLALALHDPEGADPFADTRKRVSRLAPLAGDIDPGAWMRRRLDCPLLADGACLAYAARPLSCRGWNSLDQATCRLGYVEKADLAVDYHAPRMHVAKAMQTALLLGPAMLGRTPKIMDLAPGLERVMDRPHAGIQEWVGGTDVFAGLGRKAL
jgi:hypothetical protein